MYQEGTTPWKDHPEPLLFDEFVKFLNVKKERPKVLDIGCGDGWLSVRIAVMGADVWGIDSSPTAIVDAKKDANKNRVSDHTNFIVGDALDLPFKDNFFDAVVDRGMFHHILPANRIVYRDGIKRVSRRGSLFYLIVFSRKSPEGIGQRFTKRDIETFFSDFFDVIDTAEDPFPVPAPAHLLYFILKRAR